jgi:hypothetical protein
MSRKRPKASFQPPLGREMASAGAPRTGPRYSARSAVLVAVTSWRTQLRPRAHEPTWPDEGFDQPSRSALNLSWVSIDSLPMRSSFAATPAGRPGANRGLLDNDSATRRGRDPETSVIVHQCPHSSSALACRRYGVLAAWVPPLA